MILVQEDSWLVDSYVLDDFYCHRRLLFVNNLCSVDFGYQCAKILMTFTSNIPFAIDKAKSRPNGFESFTRTQYIYCGHSKKIAKLSLPDHCTYNLGLDNFTSRPNLITPSLIYYFFIYSLRGHLVTFRSSPSA